MIYAPVIIATLNRYEHLKRCIGSLQKNEWAKYTELYISVDYPVKESHWEGYRKIKEYLEAGITGFKKVYLFFQPSNLGVQGNFMFLKRTVFEIYDRCIETEDDNEFSPCFIEFMDKGLELFKDDPDVMFICGYISDREWYTEGENILKLSCVQNFYGDGIWRDKWLDMQKEINTELFDSIGRNPYYIWRLYYYSRNMLWWYVHRYLCDPYAVMFNEDGELVPMDINHNIYCIIKKRYIITPVRSLVRNYGRDGSGENAGINPEYNPLSFRIIKWKNFEYCIPTPFRMRNKNRKIQASVDGSLAFKDNIKVLQNWILREILGYKGYHQFLEIQQRFKEKKNR